MTTWRSSFRFVAAVAIVAVAYVLSEKVQLLLFALDPSLKPIYDQLTKGWMLALFFGWFFVLALIGAYLLAWLVRYVWRKLGVTFSVTAVFGIAVFVAVMWECIDQARLSQYEDVWMLSIFNLQRAAHLLPFLVVLPWMCARGPNKGMQATAYGGA